MRRSILLLLVLSTVCGAFALTAGEIRALQDIAVSWDHFRASSSPWPVGGVESACTPPFFYGLNCTSGPDPHVKSFNVHGSMLSGSLPSSIGELLWLEEITLVQVVIKGTIPETIGSLSNLEILYIESALLRLVDYSTAMKTPLPESLGQLSQLRVLSLRLLDVTGTIPSSFDNLLRITDLSLSCVSPFDQLSVTGFFPKLFSRHTAFERIVFERTNLRGFRSSIILNSTNLLQLQLIDNIHLTLPFETIVGAKLEQLMILGCPSIGGMFPSTAVNLKMIDLNSNSIAGFFGLDFWQRTRQLERISLHGLKFVGLFSPEIANSSKLLSIVIESKGFRGHIPKEISLLSELRVLRLINTRVSGPLPSFDGCQLLAEITITNAEELGALPSSFGYLPNLSILAIQSSGLNGTIPLAHEAKHGRNFSKYDVSNNHLHGQIPQLRCLDCILKNNNFTGTIPRSIARGATNIELQFNALGPSLDSDLFIDGRTSKATIDISHNQFEAPLPELYSNPADLLQPMATFSFNKFYGNVPASWYSYGIELESNQLSGNLTPLLSSFRGRFLSLSRNAYNGTIPPITAPIEQLLLDLNQFDGNLPRIPRSLFYFSADRNMLNGTITNEFIDSVIEGRLQTLILSNNKLKCSNTNVHAFGDIMNSTLKVLNLRNNEFKCFLNPQGSAALTTMAFWSQLSVLDLSQNFFTGTFHPARFPFLAILDISFNRFSGNIIITSRIFEAITQIDISNNRFTSDVSEFDGLPFLFSLKASTNQLHGYLTMAYLPNLETLDLSNNLLNVLPDLSSIGRQFTHHSLKKLSILRNPLIPKATSFDTAVTGLNRTRTSAPSTYFRSVICYTLTFHDKEGITFTFDESLFDFMQCDCDSNHFGSPPSGCRMCPSVFDTETGSVSGVKACGDKSLLVSPNSFLLLPSEPLDLGNDQVSSTWSSLSSWSLSSLFSSTPFSTGPTSSTSSRSAEGELRFETESCLVLPEQILTQQSNCLGITLSGDDTQNFTSIPYILSTQCLPGSSGRLCARCNCDWRGEEPACYYERALRCTKCAHVFRLSQSLALIFGLLFLLIMTGSIVLFLTLRGKRVQKTRAWARVSFLKRAFYRLLYMASLGNVSILITFVQIFLELTHWDAYAVGRVLKLVNLNGETLGLKCLFPFLSEPLYGLLARLLIPFVAFALIATCTGLAELASKVFTRIGVWRSSSLLNSISKDESLDRSPLMSEHLHIAHSDDDWERNESHKYSSLKYPSSRTQPLNGTWISLPTDESPQKLSVDYPTLALFSTISISMLRFVYFSTALSAHEYLFSTTDQHTRISYVQNLPFLKTDDAVLERWLSVPVVIIFDLLLPVGFLILCYRIRNQVSSPRTKMYFGSLFEAFDRRCYWWEVVTTFKKLSIALVLRAIPASNVLQVTLIVTILTGIQIIQLTLQPWRRKIENASEAVGTSILIGALLAARSGLYANSMVSVYYVITAAAIYTFANLCLIAYQTWHGRTEYQKALSRLQDASLTRSNILTDSTGYDTQDNQSSLQTIWAYTRREESEDDGATTTDFEPSDGEIH